MAVFAGWGIPGLILLIFAICSRVERENRAFFISLALFFGWAALFFLFGFVFHAIPREFTAAPAAVWLVLILWMVMSPRPQEKQEASGPHKRTDERDVIFARFDLRKDTPRYREYYSRRPEFKEKDDRIRVLPDILSPAHMERDPVRFFLADSEFSFLENLLTLADGPVHSSPGNAKDPEENTACIKQIFQYLGADQTGVCALDPAFVYSHAGRGPEPYGSLIQPEHKYAVVFTLPMDYAVMASAPQAPVLAETARKYVEAARISVAAAGWLRRMGYSARAHMAGSNYQAILPPLGWKAGLGEIGRMGILMTPDHGPRVRLGLVTTDFPLKTDPVRVWGMQDFCRRCKKCAENCPSGAIPFSGKQEENGSVKWTIDREACYAFWRKCGTDCGRCMSVCPYSKPANPVHNAVRYLAARSRAAQIMSLWGDHVFYGKHPAPRKIKP
ncbi:MAG: reductive dehalogenase domain-containing protein [Candidatus Aminicenantes bacterium]